LTVDLDTVDLTDLDRFVAGFPHDVFTALRRERPIWFHPPTPHTPGGEGFWVLTRYDDIANAAADAAFSSVGGGTRSGAGTLIEDLPLDFAAGVLLNMMDDPRHRRVRRLATPAGGESIELAGAVEWARSNKHTGLRHMPVALHAARRRV
jgi:cytochrome P450